jgi:ubiquinone biosynthesis monooxygenase Coq7
MTGDQFIAEFDRALRTLFCSASSRRPIPGGCVTDVDLSEAEKKHVCGLMRVNHVGEVCAQALYQGQALTTKDHALSRTLRAAADEETEHLAWTEGRLAELGGRKSMLNPLWYGGALVLGTLAGCLGDRWSLGFLAETERQVGAHLDGHLKRLPEKDEKSRQIVDQMRRDEIGHAELAVALGATELPAPLRTAMRLSARLMTETAYRV